MLISFAHMSVPRNAQTREVAYVATGASDFPHSRQEVCARGVINPQNGHILCDAKPRTGGATDANSFETDLPTLANLLRRRSRNRSRVVCITSSPAFFSLKYGSLRDKGQQVNDDTSEWVILCKIAHRDGLRGITPVF